MEMRYKERMDHLRAQKVAFTQEKIRRNGYMNEDDYGSIPIPKDFHFECEFNDKEHQTFYGAFMWGKNFRRLMECHPVFINPEDALAGRWMVILQRLRPFESAVSNKNMEMAPVFNYDWLKPDQIKYDIQSGIGKMHHFAPDYQIAFELGWGGLLDKVRKYAQKYPDKNEFYTAEEDVILGIQNWISRTADEAEKMAEMEQDPLLRRNLLELAEMNHRLVHEPPKTFRDVCQTIAWINMCNRTYCRAGSGMQLDEALRPYYERDKAAGILNDDDAEFILGCLLINDPCYFQIGGPDENGNDVTSRLSYIILEAAHDVKTSVNITIRVHEKSDEGLLRRGMEILFEDKQACPRFSGDKALVSGFMRNGYSASLARKRIAVGCNWMSLPGLEYTLNDLVKINMAKVFEVAFYDMMSHPAPYSVERLYEYYCLHIEKALTCIAEGIDFHLANQYKNAPELLLNLISHGPIEKGLDASHGGMEYYNLSVDGAGLATVADSFAALERWVGEGKTISWEECAQVLKDNFSGARGKLIRAMLQNVEHYGYGGSIGDAWAEKLSRQFTDMVSSRHTPHGYLLIPGLFSWANTIAFGKTVGATPNGRLAYEPISHGANPNPGFRKDGALTAQSTAIARVQPGFGNTAPFQLELNVSNLQGEDAIDNVLSVLRTHFEMGGTLININIMDEQQILEANEDPSRYPDLIVRVTGFTAYFAALSPDFRQLVVDRIINAV